MRASAVASISTSNNENKHLQSIVANGNTVTINVLQASVVNLGQGLIPSLNAHNYGAYQEFNNHGQNVSIVKQSSPRHIRASAVQQTENSEQPHAPFIFSHMNGQLTFKGKRSGGGFGSSTNNQLSTSISNVTSSFSGQVNQALQKQSQQLNSQEQKVVGSISPFTRGRGGVQPSNASFGGKQQRQLLNKTFKKQQAQNVLQSQSLSPGNSGAFTAKNGLMSLTKKTQEQQLLYVSSLQQQNAKFQEQQSGQMKPSIMNKSPSTSILKVINTSIVNGQSPAQLIDNQAHLITAQQSSICQLQTVPQISSPAFISNYSNHPNPEASPKLGIQQKSQASFRFTHNQAFQSAYHPTLQQKLDSILSISQQPMQQLQREQLNVSTYSGGNGSGKCEANHISSSKKHRDFMRAQELSKILVAPPPPPISKVSNYQLRLKQTTTAGQELVNRSRSRDNNGTESAIYETDENVYQMERNITMDANERSLNVPKRNTILPRQPSGGIQKQGVIPAAGQYIVSQPQISLNSAQRSGSASNASQQASNGYQKQQQTIRRGSENAQRRRESSAGSRLNGLNQAIQQANLLNPQSQQVPFNIISIQTYTQEKEPTNQIIQKSFTNITQQQTATGASTNFQQSESSLNSDLATTIQNHNNRSNSSEIAGNTKYADLSEDEEAVVKSQQSGTPAFNGDRGAGGCGCDSLSQVSEESAFEEDDIEEQQKDISNNTLIKPLPKKADEIGDDGKKKKQVTIKILASMPNNAREQEDAFFESGFTINPVFEYDNPQVASRFISQFKKPRSELMSIATKIMDAFLAEYGSESNYFLTEGRVITDKDETEAIFMKYLEDLNVTDCAQINFSDKIVAPTSVTYDNYSSKIRINIQIPIEYREGRITGVLHHEIGTHFLRRFNEIQQPWHLKRKKYGLKSCIAIEEGMGCINMMLEQSKDVAALVLGEPTNEVHIPGSKRFPFLFKPALNYYACYKASEMSFVELFNDLAKYVDNPRKRWKYVLRVKRGLGDTSQPGGLYKDQVYLEGAVKILKNRKDINFKLFYCGKINIEDIKRQKFIKKANLEGNIIPKFMEDMPQFRRNLDVIAKCNFID